MPRLPSRPHRPASPVRRRRPGQRAGSGPARVVVVGDLVLDVVLAPGRALAIGSDVPGRVTLTQGGSAANTARWIARLGGRASLVCAVGRDAAGRALVETMRGDGVLIRATRVSGSRTGRIGVLVSPDGERSFVQDRGAALEMRADDLRPAWFAGADAVHIPLYSLLGEPLGGAGRRAAVLARDAGAQLSVDLASIGPLLVDGRQAAFDLLAEVAPDLLFATVAEATALLGHPAVDGLLAHAPRAVVKRGSKGATVLARDGESHLRFEVATERLAATDTTGAGDAFDAGFLIGWFAARAAGRSLPASLQRAALTGHRAAARHLTTPRTEISLG